MIREAGTLFILAIIYWPIIIYIKKTKKKVLIRFSVLLFPIIYFIIWLIFPYYYLAPFQGKVIDAVTKDPIQGARIVAEYSTISPSVAGTITCTVDNQEVYTDQEGEFRIPDEILMEMKADIKPGPGLYGSRDNTKDIP